MKFRLPQYNGKDNLVLLLVLLPVVVIMNSTYFGRFYFTNRGFFFYASCITGIACIFYFMLCGFIAVSFKRHFPRESQLLRRLSLTIATFLLMTGLFLYFLFRGYESAGMYRIRFDEAGFVWSYFVMGITNIFLTFVMEGIARHKDWKASLKETEKLNAAYKQSQLNGLKSQVNPHFLFNSLNSLSSLIQEDEAAAEKFLDEMSKVYRYMLRNDEEQLVTLDTELKFLSAYLHLLTTRYGNGLQVHIHADEYNRSRLLAPLTLQVIIENTFTQNVITKNSPLVIDITATANNVLAVQNNIQPKVVMDTLDFDKALDNLIKKYELIGKPLRVDETVPGKRIVTIPLLEKEEEVPV